MSWYMWIDSTKGNVNILIFCHFIFLIRYKFKSNKTVILVSFKLLQSEFSVLLIFISLTDCFSSWFFSISKSKKLSLNVQHLSDSESYFWMEAQLWGLNLGTGSPCQDFPIPVKFALEFSWISTELRDHHLHIWKILFCFFWRSIVLQYGT